MEFSVKEKALISLIVMIGAFMAILDTTIVDVALPKMIAPLATDLYGIQWVVTSYMIASAVLLPLIEYIENKIGLKNMFIIGVGVFSFSSYMCGISSSLTEIIFFRSLQGAAEALIMVSSQAILFSTFEEKEQGLAMGIFGFGASVAPALGPTLGGYLTQHFGWNWVFYINVPVGILNVLLSIFFLKTKKEASKKELNFNIFSFIAISISTIGLIIGLSKGQEYGWFSSNLIIFIFYVSFVSFFIYLIFEISSKNKLIDLNIFLKPNFFFAFWVYFFILGFSMYALFYALPLFFERLKDLESFKTGIILLPFAIFIAFASFLGGILSDKKSPLIVFFVSFFLYVFSLYFLVSKFDYFTPNKEASLELSSLGFSIGLFFPPITVIALKNLENKLLLVITLLDYVRFIGGSFGTAIATNILSAKAKYHYDFIATMQVYTHNFVKYFIQNSIVKTYALGIMMEKQALSEAFSDLFIWCTIFAFVGLLIFPFSFKALIKK